MKLCLFASYTYKRKSIRVFRTPILVYLDVRGVEIPLLSTVSISNCRYQEAPGEVVWSDFLAQLPRRSIEILWHLTRPSGLVKCQRISILLLGNCARISQTSLGKFSLAVRPREGSPRVWLPLGSFGCTGPVLFKSLSRGQLGFWYKVFCVVEFLPSEPYSIQLWIYIVLTFNSDGPFDG